VVDDDAQVLVGRRLLPNAARRLGKTAFTASQVAAAAMRHEHDVPEKAFGEEADGRSLFCVSA